MQAAPAFAIVSRLKIAVFFAQMVNEFFCKGDMRNADSDLAIG
jgi:hypothetical protein